MGACPFVEDDHVCPRQDTDIYRFVYLFMEPVGDLLAHIHDIGKIDDLSAKVEEFVRQGVLPALALLQDVSLVLKCQEHTVHSRLWHVERAAKLGKLPLFLF